MSTIMPEGDALRKAIKWISECRKENPDAKLMQLIHEACSRFDLSPRDSDFLYNFYLNRSEASGE